MQRWLTLALVAGVAFGALAGKGKNKPSGSGDTSNDLSSSQFVEIDLGEEEEALEQSAGEELMRATADCGDLLKLEPSAMLGQLTDSQIRCLDDALKVVERQTVKDKISRVLLNDAWAKGDEHRWEGIARRHLEEIDRSDPDMCYKFAYYLVDRGPEKMDEALKWADVALENRSVWEGDLHVKRVYALFKIKTEAAQKKWAWHEAEYNKAPSEELLHSSDDARNQTKTLSREWLEYARQSGKDTTLPLQMCISAAGTAEFCEEQ
jgi:hypothetical protein